MASDPFPFASVGVVGLGLLGGSVLKAVKAVSPGTRTIGIVRDEKSVAALGDLHFVDECSTDPQQLRNVDVVVIATPVDAIARWAETLADIVGAKAFITDVGSTKAGIVEDCESMESLAGRLVPAHPIAGSEKSGAIHADANLFRGRLTLLTPMQKSVTEVVQRCHLFWQGLGARTMETTAEIHDRELAAISHVPHLLSSLIALLPQSDSLPWAGTGWRDMTRLAAGDPDVWTAIVSENKDAIRQSIQDVQSHLETLQGWIDRQDWESLGDWLARARDRKASTIRGNDKAGKE
ncbi:MAG: prephenate dehydrogenase/arogenate dehydrogenase family protein [Planctomycetota bacterium]